MGSLRNPIGPLPSSIYWRRRAVALAVVAVLALLAVWAFSLGGGTEDRGKSGGGGGPVGTITPGPADSGPVVSERPGGREEEGAGAGDAPGDAAGASGGGSASGGSGGSGGSSSGGEGWQIPSGNTGTGTGGTAVPGCEEPEVNVTVRSLQETYRAGEKPEFELTAENEGGEDCSIDLGDPSTIVKVTDSADKDVWSSEDCRRGVKPAFVRVPAGGEAARTFVWEREPSAPDCGTPPAGSPAPGTYSIEIEIAGLKKAYGPFELKTA